MRFKNPSKSSGNDQIGAKITSHGHHGGSLLLLPGFQSVDGEKVKKKRVEMKNVSYHIHAQSFYSALMRRVILSAPSLPVSLTLPSPHPQPSSPEVSPAALWEETQRSASPQRAAETRSLRLFI